MGDRTVEDIRADWQAAEGMHQEFMDMLGSKIQPKKEHSDKGILLARIAALEADLAASQAHTARLAVALTPFTDVLTKCFHLLPVYPDDQPLFTWRHVGGFEKFFYAGAARAIAAALDATPQGSLARLRNLVAVADAARAYRARWTDADADTDTIGWHEETDQMFDLLAEALDRLDGGGA